MTTRRTQIRQAGRVLDELEAFHGLLGKLERGMRSAPRTRNPGEPDMVEIKPGVWVKLTQHMAQVPDLVGRARAVLEFAGELDERAEALGKELRAWRSKSK